jgi:hypothetical protein
MLRKPYILVCLTLLVACVPKTPPVPTPTPTPSPTLTPSPTPTATPIPPMILTIHWPEQTSALQPVPVEVELLPPPRISVTATVRAAVVDPVGTLFRDFEMAPQEGNLYAAEEPLQLPLEPIEGHWRLAVFVQAELDVEGERELLFRPTPIRFRDLTDVLPIGADLHVPRAFSEIVSQGDQVAGGRAWRYRDGEIALWWAPGPVEPLLLNNAVVMLEATHDPDAPPTVLKVEEVEWREQTAFLFHERWPGEEGGVAEALVTQGPDYHLYVLRTRAIGEETIPLILHQVGETFSLIVEE